MNFLEEGVVRYPVQDYILYSSETHWNGMKLFKNSDFPGEDVFHTPAAWIGCHNLEKLTQGTLN